MSCSSEYIDFNTGSNASVNIEAGNLPEGFCHTSFQDTFETFVASMSASLDGTYSTFLYGATEPGTEDRDKPWLRIDSTTCNPIGWYVWKVTDAAWVKADYDLEELQYVSDWMKVSNVANGSFEVVNDSGGVVNWTFTAQGTGSGAITETAAEVHHGRRAFKITGAGSGGGVLVGDFYIPIKDTASLTFKFSHISSNAATRNIAKVKFYDNTQTYMDEDVSYDSVANPTTWTDAELTVSVPSGARFAVVEFTGADSSVAQSGTWTIDDVSLEEASSAAAASSSPFGTNIVVLDTPETGNWPVPSGVTTVVVEMWGAGGGGGQDAGTAGTDQVAGGGGGGYVRSSLSVTAGGTVSYTVGSGGAAGSGGPGSSGTDTVFGSLTAGGGGGGAAGGIGSTAAGGTNSGTVSGDVSLNGESTTAVGQGGASPLGGSGGLGRINVNASSGSQPGGGGGGSYGSGTSGAGADGMIIITY